MYELTFTGGVRVAEADVNGDGVDDLIVAPGVGGGPRVEVFDGVTGKLIYNFFAYEPTFTGGLFVAGGDVNGDGYADIIIGTDQGGGPRVTIFSGKDGSELADYFAYDPSLRSGVRVAAGDLYGTGVDEVITAPGDGAASDVIVWGGGATGFPLTQMASFFAFDPSYTGGVYVAGSSAGPNGQGVIVVGTGDDTANYPGDRVRVFDGLGNQSADIEAFTPDASGNPFTSPVRVATFDANGDGIPDYAIASGPGSPPRVRIINGLNNRPLDAEFQPFESTFLGGVNIG
ncbi:Alkaline phosphatase [Fimbriiglobus ruber]|uniref:Alkaline phosphatase n=1 Tax=Fimbriiglobus ruber TaxID=1908690 RepID=A0A225DS57_9BACT|nr:Alkaline phosphatase [Fimbriiglobus ruber]